MSLTATEPAPAPAPAPRQIPRRYLALALIVVAIILLGALVIVRDNSGPSTTSTVETFNPASSSLIASLASVPASAYDAVGIDSPANPLTAPEQTGSATSPLWEASDNGTPKPVVFFYGAEFAPYAAAERWPLILALSRFGTFSKLGLMQSSATTAFANLSTFTFWQSSYTSKYLILNSVERYSSLNPTGARYLALQKPDAQQSAAIASAGSGATTFALLNVANRWELSGASYSPTVLTGLNQAQIAGTLTTPAAPLTQAELAAANEIAATICSVDGDRPDAVCEGKGVVAADAALRIPPPA